MNALILSICERPTPALSGTAPTEHFQLHPEPQQGPRPLQGAGLGLPVGLSEFFQQFYFLLDELIHHLTKFFAFSLSEPL